MHPPRRSTPLQPTVPPWGLLFLVQVACSTPCDIRHWVVSAPMPARSACAQERRQVVFFEGPTPATVLVSEPTRDAFI